jgi:ABC-type dipeptide/oligopeptide/nickel transport system permease subunit
VTEWLAEQDAEVDTYRIDLEQREVDPSDYDLIVEFLNPETEEWEGRGCQCAFVNTGEQVTVFGPWLAPQNPYDLAAIDFFDARLPPMSESMSGSVYVLGTDGQGRDMLSAMIYGLRTSLSVGLFAGFVALLVGTALGLTAAYFGGRIDTLIMRVVDLMLGLPTILVALMLLALALVFYFVSLLKLGAF